MSQGKQSFLGGAALLTVTMLITKAIGALYKIPLGNLLDEQGMNYFYAAYNIYNLLLMVSTAGLPLALSRLVSQAEALGRVNRRRRTVSVAFWLFLLLGAVSSGVMFFLAGDLAGWMHNTQAENAIRVLSPAVLCVCLVSVIRGYTQGLGDMRPTAASEIMAAFCMASDLMDMKARMARITVGRTYAGKLVTCGDIGAQGAMAALLRDAMAPNLVQTIEGTPCLMHGGPFANIAHGCNSVIATRLAMKLSDYTVTEAGFGADLGAEKFIDIKCRAAGIYPDCVVLVATIRALKHHGGVEKESLNQENVPAMLDGCANLKRHLDNIRTVWGAPAVVAINRFTSDTQAEIDALKDWLAQQNAPCALCEGWGKGGAGAQELAELAVREADGVHSRVPFFTYPDDMDLAHKIDAVARRVYGARGATFTAQAMKQLKTMEDEGFGRCPVCIAKTQYSFSDDAKRRNAPTDFDINIRSARLSAGAGFVVAFAGDIIAMPGLPRHPAALDIDVDENGVISGLF